MGLRTCAVLLISLACIVGLPEGSWRHTLAVVVGGGLGATLLLTRFGFASAFRNAAEHKEFGAFRAHALMLLVASILMLPLLSVGHFGGETLHGEVTRIGPAFVLGAILFGAGMQIGGGCASGTLFSLGGGNLRLLGTLAGFVVGSAFGAWSMAWFWTLPSLPGATIQGAFGWRFGTVLQIGVLAAIFWAARGQARSPTSDDRRRASCRVECCDVVGNRQALG